MADTNTNVNGYLVRQGSKVDYNYKEYYFDTKEDLDNFNLTLERPCPGSIAFIIATSEVYILNSQLEWKKI